MYLTKTMTLLPLAACLSSNVRAGLSRLGWWPWLPFLAARTWLGVTLAAQHLYCWLERQHELIVMGRQFVPVGEAMADRGLGWLVAA